MTTGRSPLTDVLPGVRECLRNEGWAIVPVSGALLVLPLLLLVRAMGLDLLEPKPDLGPPGPAVGLLLLAVLLLSILGQLFVTALAIGQAGETVGSLLARLTRLLPQGVAIGFIQAVPVSLGLQAMASSQPVLAFAGASMVGVGVYLFARMMVALPVLVGEGGGVLAALQRSWELTSGRTLGLIVLLLALMVGFFVLAVLLVALAAPVAAIATLLLGDPATGWGPAQWVNGLLLAALQTSLTVMVALVAGRAYRTLAG